MTIDEKVEAYRMLLNGSTYQEIADNFGVSKQRVQQLIPGGSNKSSAAINSCIYKGISDWMRENRLGYSDIAKKTDLSAPSIHMIMTGKTSPSKKTIDKILKATDLKYEKAFQEK